MCKLCTALVAIDEEMQKTKCFFGFLNHMKKGAEAKGTAMTEISVLSVKKNIEFL